MLPNIALCMLYEPFVDWEEKVSQPLNMIERAHQSVIGVLHLVPSTLDVSLVITSVLALCVWSHSSRQMK